MKDGEKLVTQNQKFALGFFSPENSSYRYVGIWFNQVSEQTVVWVANRENPINGSTGVLSIQAGNLVLYDGIQNILLWSTNISSNESRAQLLDSGNLVLTDEYNRSKLLWQSFDYLTDTWLPGAKLGLNRITGLNLVLTAWRSSIDPSPGYYSLELDPAGSPQIILYNGSAKYWRNLPWPWLLSKENNAYIYTMNYTRDVLYGSYNVKDPTMITRAVLENSGKCRLLTWHQDNKEWDEAWSAPADRCDQYGYCGPNSNCMLQSVRGPDCTCLPGFEPKSPTDYHLRARWDGCARKRNESTCRNGEGFLTVSGVKLPDTSVARMNMSLSSTMCEQECLRDCSCTGYTSTNMDGNGNGCLTWFGNLWDTRQYSEDDGLNLHVRVDRIELAERSSENNSTEDAKRKKKGSSSKKVLALTLSLVAGVLSLGLIFSYYWSVKVKQRKMKGEIKRQSHNPLSQFTNSIFRSFKESSVAGELIQSRENQDLHFFDLSTIVEATNDFSFTHKLGQGGFGSVYKGKLSNGHEIAVKRLSKESGQGIEQFKNEVILIAQLQHKNLVKLLGCCIQEEEKILVYEYLPNKSLDYFIFGHVWDSWTEDKALEIVDFSLKEYVSDQVLRCIHIGLLCVQECAADRPTMLEVVLMLCSDAALPSPKPHGFFPRTTAAKEEVFSLNEMTISTAEAR
ncbi:PAN/Apple domain [Dillenia turbinata]|uniref:non-specific serine/threonine protein kinase n=1 Tax=Dillenia turbinata TaxID=194707 RepID=A0AAN8UNG5_9MAGN